MVSNKIQLMCAYLYYTCISSVCIIYFVALCVVCLTYFVLFLFCFAIYYCHSAGKLTSNHNAYTIPEAREIIIASLLIKEEVELSDDDALAASVIGESGSPDSVDNYMAEPPNKKRKMKQVASSANHDDDDGQNLQKKPAGAAASSSKDDDNNDDDDDVVVVVKGNTKTTE